MTIKLWKTETVNSMGTRLFQVGTSGLAECRGDHSVSGHRRHAALLLSLHCIHCINCVLFLLFLWGLL